MEITCQACSTKLAIPDEKVPKDAVFKVTCPKCQEKIQVSTKNEPAPPPSAEAAPPPPPAETMSSFQESPNEGMAAPSAAEDEFVEDRRLAIACFDQAQQQATAKAGLEALGYTVHVPSKMEDAVQRIRQNKYEVVILHEEYGGSVENNLLLQTIQPMSMPLRRHMCVGLVGKKFRTFDNMMAFAKSVNFVVAEREINKIKAITRQAVTDNDQFYRVFREALRDAGKT
jgi:predicted Zn finger-like uncharacterized protein